MSGKTLSASSTSTQFARKKMRKTLETTPQPDNALTSEPTVISRESIFNTTLRTSGLRREWDNDVKFHISRHLLHLRRFRKMSQSRLAKEIGASQSQIARIESGEENITASTVERIVNALDGRFDVSIPPKELAVARGGLWWNNTERVDTTWSLVGIEFNQGTDTQEVRITVGRPFHGNTLQSTMVDDAIAGGENNG